MNPETEKLERIIVMAERLYEALEGDIAALKAGRPQEMRSLDPEIEKLTMLYSREVTNMDPQRTKAAPSEIKKRLIAATSKFRDTLKMHQRLLVRVKNASEGLIKAVANEVDRQHAPQVTYAPASANYKKNPVAMIYNGVI
ncbi:hypothetical protein FHS83_001379 [Rhizomicrobium palustre]|uniref:Flagellar protein FlgN n=1 Tax=Rhizomicrobium palustre TaxID=189966 RepID=A0A846MY60_9PROT|nr:hypothetical protein [Rhizomicrobium palustre]NIK88061.1 hypothetical protein [Rhizomicrobium palustre]